MVSPDDPLKSADLLSRLDQMKPSLGVGTPNVAPAAAGATPAGAIGRPMKRTHTRYLAYWRVAVVFEGHARRPTFHGRTNDLSTGGASVLTDYNLFTSDPVTLLIAIPKLTMHERAPIVRVEARFVYTVLSGENDQFRSGFQFIRYHNPDDQRELGRHLEGRCQMLPDRVLEDEHTSFV